MRRVALAPLLRPAGEGGLRSLHPPAGQPKAWQTVGWRCRAQCQWAIRATFRYALWRATLQPERVRGWQMARQRHSHGLRAARPERGG